MKCFVILIVVLVANAAGEVQKDDYHDSDRLDHILNDVESYMADIRGEHGHTGQKGMDPCPTACQYTYIPVCGSDGQTYSNKCDLALTACRSRRRIYVEKEGTCE